MAHQVSPVLIIYLEKKECITQNGLCEMIILITSRTGIKPTIVSCWAWSYCTWHVIGLFVRNDNDWQPVIGQSFGDKDRLVGEGWESMFVKVRCTFCVMCVTILVYTNSLLLKYFYVVILLLISNARSSTKTSILNSLGNQQTNILILFVFKMLNTSLLNFMIIFRKRGKSKVKWIHFSVLLKINSMNSAL